MTVWSVPRMWDGMTVAVLASGLSMSEAVAARFQHLPCIAVNSTFRLAPWAAMLYAADAAWWNHKDNADAHRFRGYKVKVSDGPPEDVIGVKSLGKGAVTGFSPRPDMLNTGGNSGYQAIHVAAHAGAARILLCGFDMGGGHWHGPHPDGLVETAPETYLRWIPRFNGLAAALLERNIEVINCTPGSALRCFRMMPLEDALALRSPVAA